MSLVTTGSLAQLRTGPGLVREHVFNTQTPPKAREHVFNTQIPPKASKKPTALALVSA